LVCIGASPTPAIVGTEAARPSPARRDLSRRPPHYFHARPGCQFQSRASTQRTRRSASLQGACGGPRFVVAASSYASTRSSNGRDPDTRHRDSNEMSEARPSNTLVMRQEGRFDLPGVWPHQTTDCAGIWLASVDRKR